MQSIRDEWEKAQARAAEERFHGLADDGEKSGLQDEFEASEVGRLLAPIANAWRRDGPSSKIAGPIFYRWLAKRGRAAEPSEGDLLAFALERGMVNVT